MLTMESMRPDKQVKIASETLYIYAPLAHRIGLYNIKTELEDLSLKYEHPNIYNEILEKVKGTEEKLITFIDKFSLPIIKELTNQKFKFDITSRSKSIYSIWNKMQTKKISFEEVYDLLAIRIVFDPIEGIPEKTQCWNIYSIITII